MDWFLENPSANLGEIGDLSSDRRRAASDSTNTSERKRDNTEFDDFWSRRAKQRCGDPCELFAKTKENCEETIVDSLGRRDSVQGHQKVQQERLL